MNRNLNGIGPPEKMSVKILRWRNCTTPTIRFDSKLYKNINENTGIARKYCGKFIEETLGNRFTQFVGCDDAKTMIIFSDQKFTYRNLSVSHNTKKIFYSLGSLIRMERENERTKLLGDLPMKQW